MRHAFSPRIVVPLVLAVLVAASECSAQANPANPPGPTAPDEIVLGKYLFTTNGDLSVPPNPGPGEPRISRRFIEKSKWSLEFYVDAANTYRMHSEAKNYYQESTTVEEWSSGPLEKRITKVVLTEPKPLPDKVGTLKITSVKPLGLRWSRALVMSTEPEIEVFKYTQVETYYRGFSGSADTDHSPGPLEAQNLALDQAVAEGHVVDAVSRRLLRPQRGAPVCLQQRHQMAEDRRVVGPPAGEVEATARVRRRVVIEA